MNCSTNTRFLGRRVELSACDAHVNQVEHQERLQVTSRGISAPSSGTRTTARDDIWLQFEDGKQLHLSHIDPKMSPQPGQRFTAVRSRRGRSKNPSLLYLFNHETKKGWFHQPGMKALRRLSPFHQLFIIVPLLAMLALWFSPANVRANVDQWTSPITSIEAFQVAPESNIPLNVETAKEVGLLTAAIVVPNDIADTRVEAVSTLGQRLWHITVTGWREQNAIVFGVLAFVFGAILFTLCHFFIVMPSTMTLRKQARQLVQQHCRALGAE